MRPHTHTQTFSFTPSSTTYFKIPACERPPSMRGSTSYQSVSLSLLSCDLNYLNPKASAAGIARVEYTPIWRTGHFESSSDRVTLLLSNPEMCSRRFTISVGRGTHNTSQDEHNNKSVEYVQRDKCMNKKEIPFWANAFMWRRVFMRWILIVMHSIWFSYIAFFFFYTDSVKCCILTFGAS